MNKRLDETNQKEKKDKTRKKSLVFYQTPVTKKSTAQIISSLLSFKEQTLFPKFSIGILASSAVDKITSISFIFSYTLN